MSTINKSARFPPLNTLRFIPANASLPEGYNTWPFDQGFFYQQVRLDFQAPANYFQKVNSSDMITIYFDCLATSVNILILDGDSNIVATLVTSLVYTDSATGNLDPDFGDQYYTYIYQFSPSDIPLDDGFYYVAIQSIYAGDTDPLTNTIFVAECIQVMNEGWNNTILLEYSNDTNDYDVFWEPISTPQPWAFRVEAYLDIDPTFHDVEFEGQRYVVNKLQSVPYRFAKFIVGGNAGVPPWVLDKVNRIISCDNFTIDGVQWKKEPGNYWSFKVAQDYPMKAGTITLRDNPSNSEWIFSNKSDPGVFRIHDDTFDDTHD